MRTLLAADYRGSARRDAARRTKSATSGNAGGEQVTVEREKVPRGVMLLRLQSSPWSRRLAIRFPASADIEYGLGRGGEAQAN